MKLLFVEDDIHDLETFESTCKRYVKQTGSEVTFVAANSIEEALKKMDKSVDGAIVDIKLGSELGGNTVIENIQKDFRIPIAIMTGTPGNVDSALAYLGVYKKGEIGYDKILENLIDIHKTGLTLTPQNKSYKNREAL